MAPSHITERLLPPSFYFLIQSALVAAKKEKLSKILGKGEEEEPGEALSKESSSKVPSTSQKVN